MANMWKIVSQEGNPTETGDYECIVIHTNGFGERVAAVADRFFQKDNTWSEGYPDRVESYPNTKETVYAWSPDTYKTVDLPDGVEWEGWVY